jgi:hypothetical protein
MLRRFLGFRVNYMLFVSYLAVNTQHTPHGQTAGDEAEFDGQLAKTWLTTL